MAKAHPLSKIRLFAGLSSEQLDAIERAGERRKYSAGETLFAEGEEGAHVYCLLSGRVELSVAMSDQTEQVPVHVATPGSVFGEFVLFEQRPRSATARAVRGVHVLAVAAEDMHASFVVDPQAGYVVMHNLCNILVERMRKTTSELRASLMW